MHPNQQGQAMIANEMMGLLDKNPALLKKRSSYASQARHLKVDQPAARGTYPEGNLPFRFSTPQPSGRVQYRLKPYFNQEPPRDFGEWLDAKSVFNEGIVKGNTGKITANKYSFQFRTLDEQGKVSGLGGVDHVTITGK